MLEIITVFVAHGDGGERGIGPVIGVCDTKTNAQIIAKGKAWYGGDGNVNERRAVLDTETKMVYLLDRDANLPVEMNTNVTELKRQIKEDALNKLTQVERDVLGVK